MEHYYKAYTKSINDTTFYFVKKYTSYPEFQETPAILEKFGMHKNFKKACNLADVYDLSIIEKLYDEATANLVSEQAGIVIENTRTNNAPQKSSFIQRFILIKKSFTSRITHWHLMPH